MPGQVSITEAQGQPTLSTDVDFAMCLVGYASSNPLAALQVSVPYSSPAALVSDYGFGDAVDAGTQALTKTNGNPSPPPLCLLPTPATTAGTFSSIDITGVTGTVLPAIAASPTPRGTFQVVVEIVDDGNDGDGAEIGTAGITYQISLDNGRTFGRITDLGTDYAITDSDHGFSFDLEPPAAQITALVTLVNDLRTDLIAHFALTAGSVHSGADATSGAGIGSAASDEATAITLANQLRTAYGLHRVNTSSVHGAADSTNVVSHAAATTAQEAIDLAIELKTDYNAHRVLTAGSVHGAADSTNVTSAANPTHGTLVTGDTWSISTVPPQWANVDLYDPSDPDDIVGALASIAHSDQQFGLIVITEPVATSSFSTLTTGLTYINSFGKRPAMIVRFRDPTSGETDAAYIAAFRTFAAANNDNRIACVVGSGWLTDLYSARVYLRSGLPALLARLQSFQVIDGEQGERLGQHPGWVGRGPLENFSIVDSDGELVGHDEQVRGGIDGPIGSEGGGITFYRPPNPDIPGTYVSEAPVLHLSTSTILTLMDRRVANAFERVASAIAWQNIQGAAIYDRDTLALDDDIKDAISGKIAKALRARYAREIQNADDPNLVEITPTVEVTGARVTIRGVLNVRLLAYIHTIALEFSATR